MRKYICIIFLMVCFTMFAQNALAVGLRNAEDFRIEVTAEPAYEQCDDPAYIGGVYYADIVAVNNSNDVINLEGLSYEMRVVPLDGNIEDAVTTITTRTTYPLDGSRDKILPPPVEIQPHSKIVLRTSRVECKFKKRKEEYDDEGNLVYRTITIRPANDILIIVTGLYLYDDEPVFTSSVHVRYKDYYKDVSGPIYRYRSDGPIYQPDEDADEPNNERELRILPPIIRYNNFPKGLSSE